MNQGIVDFKDKHKGEDIWLILAGSSLDYVDPSFFEGKLTICQNQTYRKFKADYVVMKDCNESPRFPESIRELDELSIPLIYSEYYKGYHREGRNEVNIPNSYLFKHNLRYISLEEEIKLLKEDEIVVSRSTITSLMHIAAYMGAKNIMICGHDCGTINGKMYYEGYVQQDWVSASNWSGISSWLSKLENESIMVKEYLKEKYDCNIHSLNPFLNMNFESNTFVKS